MAPRNDWQRRAVRPLFAMLTIAVLACRRDVVLEEARAPLPGGYELRIARRADHPTLAEYVRHATLTRGDSVFAADSLFPDTGGYGRLDLVAIGPQRFLLRGQMESYVVDTEHHTIARAEPAAAAAVTALPLGTFDTDSLQRWAFRARSES